jgi:hypothetical protein
MWGQHTLHLSSIGFAVFELTGPESLHSFVCPERQPTVPGIRMEPYQTATCLGGLDDPAATVSRVGCSTEQFWDSRRSAAAVVEPLVRSTFFPIIFTGCGPLCRSTPTRRSHNGLDPRREFYACKVQDRSSALECAIRRPSHDDLECSRRQWQCSRHGSLRFAKCSDIESRCTD